MKKVVVIGGGFAGSYIARRLEKDFDTTLIDSKDYFEFTPGILRTIVEPEHIRKIQVLHTHYLRRSKVIVGCVDVIAKDYIILENKKIYFDYLVICSGSSYNVPFKEKNVVNVARAKHLRDCYKELCEAKKVLIIGGGLVGIELAAEICTHYRDKEITIIHSKDKLIERNHERAIKYADNSLKKEGVKIVFNERVIQKKKGFFLTDKGNEFKADMAFLCTGITPNYDFMKKNFSSHLNEKNQIKVNKTLQLFGERNIFAAGDIIDMQEEKTAQNAERQAKIVVENIIALEENRDLQDYHTRTGPLVISLGKWNGIFTYKNINFGGIIPAFLKFIIEKKEMLKFTNRLTWFTENL